MGKAESEGMSVLEVPMMMPADSGLGSTAPSEIVDSEANEFTSSQEDTLTSDPSFGGPKKTYAEYRNGVVAMPVKTTPIAALPQRSATADSITTTRHASNDLSSMSDKSLVSTAANHVLPPPRNLVSMVSASTAASGSGASIAAVEGGEE